MDYKDFHTIFLAEMPWRVPGGNDFSAQLEMLHELIAEGYDVTAVGNSIFKITANDQISYWHGTADAENVSIIIDTTVSGNFCKVVLTSKNPTLPARSAPYASDMYLLIKQDLLGDSLAFASDELMSDDAIKLWKRLSASGNTISVYDTTTRQYALDAITDASELESFIGGPDKQKYIFVLSESREHYVGTRHAIGLMELKRNAGYPLQELFEQLKKK